MSSRRSWGLPRILGLPVDAVRPDAEVNPFLEDLGDDDQDEADQVDASALLDSDV